MDATMTSSDEEIGDEYVKGRLGVGNYQFVTVSPAKSNSRKSPVKMTSDESSSMSDFEYAENNAWGKYGAAHDSTSTSKDEKKTKALNNQVS